MKKLGKLSINIDKIIKNEELVNLRGGYDYGSGDYKIECYDGGKYGTLVGIAYSSNCYDPSPGAVCFHFFGVNCCDFYRCTPPN